jgi:plasmid stabilization system protein ParE
VVQITLSPKFIFQLKEICQYFAENRSDDFARQFEEKGFQEIEKLEHGPQRWQRVEIPHVEGEFRRILVGPHQVFYELSGQDIFVHAIVDGRRRPPLFHPD